jgi:tetratricopeptide (TPR) repeat protein
MEAGDAGMPHDIRVARMADIKAFVGHSFSDADATVVQGYLKYFDQIKALLPSFNWVHAQSAEPKELAQKVNNLIADCNVFVGICTSKERVIPESKLNRGKIFSENLSGKDSDFEWKTSDWVIQEIGLAVGRGMSLVLLLESGCRKPGGIQGDVEFIPFDRNFPERAFGPLLEMIRALSPAAPLIEAAASEGSAKSSPETTPQSDEDQAIPDSSWDREKYADTFIWKLLRSDLDAAVAIDEAYLKTAEANDPEKRDQWSSFTELWRIIMSRGGSLDKIRALHAQRPENAKILENLASALSNLGSHVESAEKYQLAAEQVKGDELNSSRLLRCSSEQLARAKRLPEANSIMSGQLKFIESNPSEELSVLYSIKSISEISKDDDLFIETLERIIHLKPDDFDSRFSLAYKHSEVGNADLAFYHYLQIPIPERNSITWNNIGVSFQGFSMPASAVRAYQKAASMGETLAMSNLGYKFMQAGFVDQADEEFKKAIQIEDFHKNVGEGISALKAIFENEDKLRDEALEKSRDKVELFRKLGHAITQAPMGDFEGVWAGPDCELKVSVRQDSFIAVGEYERTSKNALASMLAAKVDHFKVEYIGKIFGRRVIGTVKRTAKNKENSTVLGSLFLGDKDIRFCAIIPDDISSLSVAENFNSTNPRFYSLSKVE